MFPNTFVVALYLIRSFGFSANALPHHRQDLCNPNDEYRCLAARMLSQPQPPAFSDDSSSYSSQTQVSSFVSSWKSLSNSFSECQDAFSQRASISEVTKYVQNLQASYQAAVSQYHSCSVCDSHLSQHDYTSEIRQSVAEMYSSLQFIISTGPQVYGDEFQSQFASTFQSMSSFESFSQKVCSSAGVDLDEVLANSGVNQDVFSQLSSLKPHSTPPPPHSPPATTVHSSQTQVSSFISSWQSLSESFSQCESAFSQGPPITVATKYVQKLHESYQTAFSQYGSCSACASSLSQSGYASEIQQSVTKMYSSFQSIISTGRQAYGDEFQSQFASTFQSMSSFESFSKKVCSSAGLDLSGILAKAGIQLNVLLAIGGGDKGLLGGLLGGGEDGGHGLIGSLLG